MSRQDRALGQLRGPYQPYPTTAHLPHGLQNQNVHPVDLSSYRPRETTSISSPRASNSPFACPFYKFNPAVCDGCKKFQFVRISDMKQHLVRFHSLSEFPASSCAVCHSPFMDEQSRMLHLRHGNCRNEAAPEKLSPQEVIKLKEIKFRRGSSAASQWFAIWNQLFPGHTRPQTPYKESNNIKEVISLISPTVESYFYAAFPILSGQHRQSDISPIKIIMDNVCRDFCNNLPTSRQGPSIKDASLDNVGHSQGGRVAPNTLLPPSFANSQHDATAVLASTSLGNNLASMAPTIDSTLGFGLPEIPVSINVGLDNAFFTGDPFSPCIHDHTFGDVDVDESGFAEFVGDN